MLRQTHRFRQYSFLHGLHRGAGMEPSTVRAQRDIGRLVDLLTTSQQKGLHRFKGILRQYERQPPSRQRDIARDIEVAKSKERTRAFLAVPPESRPLALPAALQALVPSSTPVTILSPPRNTSGSGLISADPSGVDLATADTAAAPLSGWGVGTRRQTNHPIPGPPSGRRFPALGAPSDGLSLALAVGSAVPLRPHCPSPPSYPGSSHQTGTPSTPTLPHQRSAGGAADPAAPASVGLRFARLERTLAYLRGEPWVDATTGRRTVVGVVKRSTSSKAAPPGGNGEAAQSVSVKARCADVPHGVAGGVTGERGGGRGEGAFVTGDGGGGEAREGVAGDSEVGVVRGEEGTEVRAGGTAPTAVSSGERREGEEADEGTGEEEDGEVYDCLREPLLPNELLSDIERNATIRGVRGAEREKAGGQGRGGGVSEPLDDAPLDGHRDERVVAELLLRRVDVAAVPAHRRGAVLRDLKLLEDVRDGVVDVYHAAAAAQGLPPVGVALDALQKVIERNYDQLTDEDLVAIAAVEKASRYTTPTRGAEAGEEGSGEGSDEVGDKGRRGAAAAGGRRVAISVRGEGEEGVRGGEPPLTRRVRLERAIVHAIQRGSRVSDGAEDAPSATASAADAHASVVGGGMRGGGGGRSAAERGVKMQWAQQYDRSLPLHASDGDANVGRGVGVGSLTSAERLEAYLRVDEHGHEAALRAASAAAAHAGVSTSESFDGGAFTTARRDRARGRAGRDAWGVAGDRLEERHEVVTGRTGVDRSAQAGRGRRTEGEDVYEERPPREVRSSMPPRGRR